MERHLWRVGGWILKPWVFETLVSLSIQCSPWHEGGIEQWQQEEEEKEGRDGEDEGTSSSTEQIYEGSSREQEE